MLVVAVAAIAVPVARPLRHRPGLKASDSVSGGFDRRLVSGESLSDGIAKFQVSVDIYPSIPLCQPMKCHLCLREGSPSPELQVMEWPS